MNILHSLEGMLAHRNQPQPTHEVFDPTVPLDLLVADEIENIVRKAQRTESLHGYTLDELSEAAGRAMDLDPDDPARMHIQAAVQRLLDQQAEEFNMEEQLDAIPLAPDDMNFGHDEEADQPDEVFA